MSINDIAVAYTNSFRANHVLLYIGQNTSTEEIKKIAPSRWSAVITTIRTPEFSSFFLLDNRKVTEYSKRSDIPHKPLNQKELPIIRLFGIEGETADDIDEIWDTEGPDFDNAYNLLDMLPVLLNYVNILSIVGIDSESDSKIFTSKRFGQLLRSKIANGSLYFWGLSSPDHISELFGRIVDGKSFNFCSEKLSNIINADNDEYDASITTEAVPDFDNDVFYRGKQPVSISQTDLLRIKNVGELLTEKTIYRIRPFGRIQCRQWFTNFLELSCSQEPQWYGYLPQSTFYVKRSFEDTLVQLVRKALAGKGLTDKNEDPYPIILEGSPGSSKSITLAALAYRIYNEKINPVIFISKDSFIAQEFSPEFDALCDSLELLQDAGGIDTRVLIVWDSSAYRSVVSSAKKLLERLSYRGRRVVLVCSSYSINNTAVFAGEYYRLQNRDLNVFEKCDNENAEVTKKAGCLFVKATRLINEHEQNEFWNRVKDFSGIPNEIIRSMKVHIESDNSREIFNYYYKLISVLRESLERGLQAEQSKVFNYVQKRLDEILAGIKVDRKNKEENSVFYQAMIKAGISINAFENDRESIKPSEDLSDSEEETCVRLDKFNTCIALFSRFKLSVPYNLAYSVLVGGGDGDPYSTNSRQLFRIVTQDIPWLIYGEDDNGDYSFKFRNPLEAEIFLNNHGIGGEALVDLVVENLKKYGEEYRDSLCFDKNLGQNIQSLLRLIGPNSTYQFRDLREHVGIVNNLNRLIDSIIKLDEEYGVPDRECGFASIAITFIREYYGHKWDDIMRDSTDNDPHKKYGATNFTVADYEHRIDRLLWAISKSEQCIDELEKYINENKFYNSKGKIIQQMDSLAVESTLCNMNLEDVILDYLECCYCFEYEPNPKYRRSALHYSIIFNQLSLVIAHQPTNGYAYNALFRAFERTYERSDLSEVQQLQYLSEIMQIVEECEARGNDIIDRGDNSDELGKHLTKIQSYATGLPITIDTMKNRNSCEEVDERTKAFFYLYDSMLDANNPAAITFICQKELDMPKYGRIINDVTSTQCEKIINFMTMEKNFQCVSSSSYSLALLIRVSWMYFTGIVLNGSDECQTPKVSQEQWNILVSYCQQYYSVATSNVNKQNSIIQPNIMLIYALSTIQVGSFSENSFRQASEILRSISEEYFYQQRMRTPFMLCDNNGKPKKHTGTVIYVENENGNIRINGIPSNLYSQPGIRFRHYNLGRKQPMPKINEVLENIEIGIGYTGFSAYTETGRAERRRINK